MHQPAEVYSLKSDSTGLSALTHHNASLLAALDMNRAEEIWEDGTASSEGPTALQRRGVESKLLYFPDEGHWISRPQNSELFYKTALG
jgi:hypothetical protein